MHITWLGQTTIKLHSKYLDEDVITVCDPYRPKSGDFPRNITAHNALFSRGADGSIALGGEPFVIQTLCEFDTKGLLITSVPGPEGTVLFKLSVEGMHIVHTGILGQKLPDSSIAALGKIDILILPVGGGRYLNPADAADLVTALEPRIVIPVGFQCDTDPDALNIEAFIKQLGIKPEETDKKFSIKAKDLPSEETKVVVLEKSS